MVSSFSLIVKGNQLSTTGAFKRWAVLDRLPTIYDLFRTASWARFPFGRTSEQIIRILIAAVRTFEPNPYGHSAPYRPPSRLFDFGPGRVSPALVGRGACASRRGSCTSEGANGSRLCCRGQVPSLRDFVLPSVLSCSWFRRFSRRTLCEMP